MNDTHIDHILILSVTAGSLKLKYYGGRSLFKGLWEPAGERKRAGVVEVRARQKCIPTGPDAYLCKGYGLLPLLQILLSRRLGRTRRVLSDT